MSNELRSIWTHSRIYALGAVLNRSAGLVLIPVYTHVLPVEDFGVYSLVIMTSELVGVFFGVGLVNAMACLYFDFQQTLERNRVISTAFIGFALLGLATSVLLYPLSRISNWVLFGPQDRSLLFLVAYVSLLFSVLLDLGLGYFRLRLLSWMYLWVSLAKTVLFLGFNILFVLGLNYGVIGIFLGTLLSSLLLSLSVGGLILRQVGWSFSPALFRTMVRIGFPLAPATVADAAFQATDKFFLNRLFSTEAVGQYALGGRVASLLHAFIAAPFGQIWVVRRLESLKSPGQEGPFRGVFTYFIVFLTVSALAMSLFAPELVHALASQEYIFAIAAVPLLAVAYVMLAINMHFEIGLYHAKKTSLLMLVCVACATLNVPLSYVLISQWAILGASVSVFLTTTLRAAMTGWLSIRYCRVPLEFESRRIAAILAMAVVSYSVGRTVVGTTVTWPGGMAKAGIVIAFILSLFATGLISVEERRTLGLLFRQEPRMGVS